MTATRKHLPNRRANETSVFNWLGMSFTATIARFDDGALAEIFLSNGRIYPHADAATRNSAVVASLALHHGVPVETLRRALGRDSRGVAGGPLGAVLDLIAERDRAP